MADKTDSVTLSQPGKMNLTANRNGRPPKPLPPPKPQHLRRNGETIRKTVRPRSCVIPVNGNGSSMGALAGSQMQLAFSAWLNGVLSNSHLAVDPSVQELLMNAGISSTTTSSNSSLLILKVTISTTDDIFDRLSDWETDVTTLMIVARAYSHLHWHIYCFKYTESDLCRECFFGNETKAVQNAEYPSRTWTILTGATVVNIHTAANTGGDPPETATVDIFCNRLSGVGQGAVDAVYRALLGPDDSCIFSRARVPTENVNVVVTYSN